MSWLVHGAKAVRTITFPSTVRQASEYAFHYSQSLESFVLNDGLEELWGHYDKSGYDEYYSGLFADSGI